MGLLAELARPGLQASWPTTNDLWSGSAFYGNVSQTGLRVNAQTALQSSAVWGCVDTLANTFALMPIKIYRRRPDGGREEAPEHPLWDLLQSAPNTNQTAYGFKHVMMVWALLWGNAYARILPGPRGPVDQLVPLHPDRVSVERIAGPVVAGFQTYRNRYHVADESGKEVPTNDDDIFHLPGLSVDGTQGLSLIDYARDSIGLALAAKGYSSRFYGNGARPDGILSYEGTLNDKARDAMLATWSGAHGGVENSHKVAAMPASVKWVPTGMNNEDAQLIEQLDWSVEDVARFFHMPLHMVQHMTKSTAWGSGIEEMWLEFFGTAMLPWSVKWENTIQRDLIIASRIYYAKVISEALLRGKLKERYDSYAEGLQNGWLNVDRICELEDMNPVGGAGGQMHFRMANLVPLDAPAPVPAPMPAPAAPPNQGGSNGHYHMLLHEAATTVVHKETTVLSKLALRQADQPEAWHEALSKYCQEHVDYVSQKLRISRRLAEGYARDLEAQLLNEGLQALEDENERIARLMSLALGGDDNG